MNRYPSEDVARFDQQFAETEQERSERQRAKRLSVQRAIGACAHDFGPNPDPDGTQCRKGCGAIYQQ